jgi:hypothetical protein
MKTFLIIFSIIAIIGVGLYLKHKGIIFSDKKNINSSQNVFSNSDSSLLGNDSIKPVNAQKWNEVLNGKWKFAETYSNEKQKWEMTGDIDFFVSNEFSLHITVKPFSPDVWGKWNSGNPGGGYTRGKWKLSQNGFLLYDLKDCQMTYIKGEKGCEYFQDKIYGDAEGDFKRELKSLSDTSIEITGKIFSSDMQYSCTLKKM